MKISINEEEVTTYEGDATFFKLRLGVSGWAVRRAVYRAKKTSAGLAWHSTVCPFGIIPENDILAAFRCARDYRRILVGNNRRLLTPINTHSDNKTYK